MNKRVLVVEDEALIRWSLRERLQEQGFEVLEAGDGESALDYISHDGICGVVLDLRLPDMSGIDVLRAFREHHADCPAWIMTAYGTPEIEDVARELGIHDFINKPFDVDAFVEKVSEIFRRD